MKVFLIGPMAQLPGLNFLAFDKAELYLVSQSHCDMLVVNPATYRQEDYFIEPHKLPHGNFVVDMGWTPMQAHGLCCKTIPRDVDEMGQCHAVALIPGYEQSQYAIQLLCLARMMGKLEMLIPGAVSDTPLPALSAGDDDETEGDPATIVPMVPPGEAA